MLLTIDPQSDRPLFEQVAASVRSAVLAGRLQAGDRLPSARDVATGLDINLHTVLRAFQMLREEGLVDLRRGRGAVITRAAVSLTDLHADIRELVQRAASLGISSGTLSALIREDSA